MKTSLSHSGLSCNFPSAMTEAGSLVIHLRCALLALLLFGPQHAVSQPAITVQPVDRWVSPGATATFRVTAKSAVGPLTYQWIRGDTARPNATNASLVLTDIHTSDAGSYSVAVTDPSGTTNSRLASLDVDSTFTKVTRDDSVNLSATTYGCAFGDFDGDGFMDLYVANHASPRNCLYHNNGNGSFTEIRTGLWATNRETATGGVWGDFDNDGLLDLLVVPYDMKMLALYRNQGDGVFTSQPSAQVGLGNRGNFMAAAWADVEPDGFLDFVSIEYEGACSLYRNDRKGGFTRITGSGLPTGNRRYHGCTWADYDRDGRLDLFLTVYTERSQLYRNLGNGKFAELTERPPASASGDLVSAAWGDYNNDGYPDLFAASGGYVSSQRSHLYQGDAGNGFLMVTNGGPDAVAQGVSGSWGDYDNDGFLDLFVCNAVGQDNCLYHNEGNKTFTRISRGSPVHDGAHSVNGIWGDVNNDGFLDLYVGNGGSDGSQMNFLYLNNGNSNAWLVLKLIGTVSNRDAIGAKVEINATVGGRSLRQSREISGGTGWCAQNDPRVHFGLGDAKVAESIRIEWPSGITQELHGVPVRRLITVTEPARLTTSTKGGFEVQCWKGMTFEVQWSADLSRWTAAENVTNVTGTLEVADQKAGTAGARFYRVLQR